MRTKIDLYRRLARIANEQELAEFADELVDRFGALPEVVQRLIELARLRIFATGWQIHSIHVEDGYLVFGFANRPRIEQLKASSSQTLRIVDDHAAYLPLGTAVTDGEAIYEAAKSLLQPA
jgi:transcription-repair coupling factor (superfamily II helicase)